MFSDHMVLQRERPIIVWGTATSGDSISIALSSGAHASAQADAHGRWTAELPPMAAGGPFDLTVSSAKDHRTLRDVMVGEVWVLSGQSNMAFTLARATNAAQVLASADRPQVRLLTIPKADALDVRHSFHAQWQECTPALARDFSAVGYFFGAALADDLHVPIGLILSSWPGTQAEEWTPSNLLEADKDLSPIVARWRNAAQPSREAAQGGFPFSLEISSLELIPKTGNMQAVPEALSGFSKGSIASPYGGSWTYTWETAPLTSWTLHPTEGVGFTSLIKGLLRNEDSASLHLSLSADGTPVDLSGFQSIRFQMRGSGFFQLQAQQPTVQDSSDYSGSVFHPTADWTTVELPFSRFKQPSWGLQVPFTQNSISGFQFVALAGGEEFAQRPPSGLFNAMIAPIAPFPVRGVLWYQGEGNAGRAYQYRTLLAAMIKGWRTAWKADVPFILIQLPQYGPVSPDPEQSAWAELREAQTLVGRMPGNALVTTIDLGQSRNVHPPDKAEFGRRAALTAEGTLYGQNIPWTGAIYRAASPVGGSIRLQFASQAGPLRVRDGAALRSFTIAGKDRSFVRADARIENEAVIVSSPAVPHPVAVRYDWADSPDGNLTDGTGLPAAPFRTDEWPGMTFDLH